MTKRRRLRVTQIGMYRDCPAKFKALVLDGIQEPRSWIPTLGTAVHAVMEQLSLRRMHGEQTTARELWQWLHKEWSFLSLGVDDWHQWQQPDMTPEGAEERGRAMVLALARLSSTWPKPAMAEQEVVAPLDELGFDGWELKGTIDLVCADGSIRDWKTAINPWPSYKHGQQRQPIYYSWLAQQAGHTLSGRFVFGVVSYDARTGQAMTQELETVVTHEDIAAGLMELSAVLNLIEAEQFDPAGDCRFCPLKAQGGCVDAPRPRLKGVRW